MYILLYIQMCTYLVLRTTCTLSCQCNIHPFVQCTIHPFVQSHVHPFVQWYVYSFVQWIERSFVHSVKTEQNPKPGLALAKNRIFIYLNVSMSQV